MSVPKQKVNRTLLSQGFLKRSSLEVAPDLLGKYLVRRVNGEEFASMLVEVEAYDGVLDEASHAFRGKTARNSVTFGEAGYWYIYLIYGMHFMLNIVTDKKDVPSAVLVRGVSEVSGPGKLTKTFAVDKSFYGKPIEPSTNLWLEDRGVKISRKDIKQYPRVGLGSVGDEWKNKPYRFVYDKQ